MNSGLHHVHENLMLHANVTALCFIEIELLLIEVSLWECRFLTCYAPVTLISTDPISFIYEVDLYPLEIYRVCENELPTSRISQVIVKLQTYIQTGRHTQNYIPHCFVDCQKLSHRTNVIHGPCKMYNQYCRCFCRSIKFWNSSH